MEGTAPAISLRQRSARRESATNRWRIAWTVENHGKAPLELSSARLPHGQFKSDQQSFVPMLRMAGGAAEDFETSVRCEEAPGPVTENAFMIFEANWQGAPWRIFVRIRVDVLHDGDPNTAVQSITSQRVGFSQHLQTNEDG